MWIKENKNADKTEKEAKVMTGTIRRTRLETPNGKENRIPTSERWIKSNPALKNGKVFTTVVGNMR